MKFGWGIFVSCALFTFAFSANLFSQNFDLKYELPDILRTNSQQQISDFSDFQKISRPRILQAIDELYGIEPDEKNLKISFVLAERADSALGGIAKRLQYKIKIEGTKKSKTLDLLVYIPLNAALPAPAFLAISGGENFRACLDPAVKQSDDFPKGAQILRGADSDTWNIETILKRGYAFAIFNAAQVFADSKSAAKNSVYTLSKGDVDFSKTGAISAWGWSAKIAFNSLQKIGEIDASRVALVGHSRFGKAALIASARHPLFKLTILNGSGCMGASLSRRGQGETVAIISKNFPHWFAAKLADFSAKEYALKIDQNEILALIAPRSLYIAGAEQDSWADTEGEFLSLIDCGKVYALCGKTNFPKLDDYKVGSRFFGDCAWHLRSGKHDLTLKDWLNFLDYADINLF